MARASIVVLFFSLLIVASSQQQGISDGFNKIFNDLKSHDRLRQEEATESLKELRKTLVTNLQALLEIDEATICHKSEANIAKLKAIELLGIYVVDESCDKIIDNIFYGVGEVISDMVPSPPPPSIEALVRIGKPSVERIVKRLEDMELSESIKFVYPKQSKRQWDKRNKEFFLALFYKLIISRVYGEFRNDFMKKTLEKARDAKKELLCKNLNLLIG